MSQMTAVCGTIANAFNGVATTRRSTICQGADTGNFAFALLDLNIPPGRLPWLLLGEKIPASLRVAKRPLSSVTRIALFRKVVLLRNSEQSVGFLGAIERKPTVACYSRYFVIYRVPIDVSTCECERPDSQLETIYFEVVSEAECNLALQPCRDDCNPRPSCSRCYAMIIHHVLRAWHAEAVSAV